MKKVIWIIIGVLVVAAIALVVLNPNKNKGIKVSAEAAANATITETVTASGKIFPEVEVKVSPDISGEIVELNVNEGDTVKRGQVLARIYADIYASTRDQASAGVQQAQAQVANAEAQLESLRASLTQAKNAYDRQKQLLDDKVISRAEFEVAEQTYLSAQANLSAAQKSINANKANVKNAMAGLTRASKDVSRATLTAPMDGVISLLSVKKGERVSGNSFTLGTEMMRIADLKSIELQVEVGENDITKVKIGDTAEIDVDAYGDRKFKGTVYKIANPVAIATNLTTEVTKYKVHIRLIYDSYKDLIGGGKPFPFRPNMSANANIQTNTKRNILTVPLSAVATRDKEKEDSTSVEKKEDGKEGNNNDVDVVVFVLQADNTVKKLKVTTGIQDLKVIEITGGIKAGDKVITGPNSVVTKTLKENDKVNVVPKEELFSDNK